MRTILMISVLMLSAALFADNAHSDSTKRDEIRSASVTIGSGETGVLLIVPADRIYILTQACQASFNGGEIAGSEFGILVTETPGRCTEYTPGIVFQPDEQITYTTNPPDFPGETGTNTANITGVLMDLSEAEEDDD